MILQKLAYKSNRNRSLVPHGIHVLKFKWCNLVLFSSEMTKNMQRAEERLFLLSHHTICNLREDHPRGGTRTTRAGARKGPGLQVLSTRWRNMRNGTCNAQSKKQLPCFSQEFSQCVCCFLKKKKCTSEKNII